MSKNPETNKPTLPDSKPGYSKFASRLKELPFLIVPRQVSTRDAALLGMFDAATIYSTCRFANAVVNGAGMTDYLQGAGMLIAASCTASAGIIGRMIIRSSPSE